MTSLATTHALQGNNTRLVHRFYGLKSKTTIRENTFFFGTRKFVVVGTGVVGCCPAQRASNDGECNEDANSMSVHYNYSLKSMLQELKVGLHVNYTFFETCSVITDIIQDAASYGIYLIFLLY
ncbi:GDSL esterase/lipase [Prunus yedoensis var. nudiflora]|uniref:GDSL esterase/lipase n=1 Tax=Prunus yedoensis var. nudiflora TaxID=2094558 RepID=A0A314YDD6_PRUYE|nr:GDSL esterase/lipase [Prunus yedoensis var. nudiflora]